MSSSGPFVPAELKRRDKIPRTPIDPDLLAQIRQDNVRSISFIIILDGTVKKLRFG